MDFKEMTLEDIIWDNSQSPEGRELLEERGLLIKGNLFRQLDLGSYGRADLISFSYEDNFPRIVVTIYELKKGKIGIDALLQAYRYLTALKRHGIENEWVVFYKIVLIGDSIDTKSGFTLLYNELENVTIYTYSYSITGIVFIKQDKGWYNTDERLNDYTRETIESEILAYHDKLINSELHDSNK